MQRRANLRQGRVPLCCSISACLACPRLSTPPQPCICVVALHSIELGTPASLTAEVLLGVGIYVCQIRIPQISVLLEILHPLLQERAAPEMCVSSVLWAGRADA